MFVLGLASDHRLAGAHALSRRIAGLGFRPFAVNLNQHRVVDVMAKGIFNGTEIGLVAIRRELNAIGQTGRQIVHEVIGRARIAPANKPAGNELSVAANGRPGPRTAPPFSARFARGVLLLRANKRPNLITLDALAGKVHENFVLIV